METVTIIVPVYNVEKYIGMCIESLCGQTYRDLEIILVNDGSTDSSGSICNQMAQRDARIKVVHKQNEGLGFARNSGLEFASGKYVAFVDADDTADSSMIEQLMKPILNDGADTVTGGFVRITEDGKIRHTQQYHPEVFTGEAVYQKLFARMLGSAPDKHDAIKMSVWNVLYSMSIIRAHNIRFPSEREFISEDIIWNNEYYRYAKRAEVIDSVAYRYRITPGSLTLTYKENRLELICTLYKVMRQRIDASEEMLQRLQRQFFVNLRTCIRQEQPEISGNSGKTFFKKIGCLLNDPTVIQALQEYPIQKIQFRQRVFLLMLKYRLSILIAAAVKLGLI